jgi:dTDP-4-dehydrorhamnose 3,5-epimerase
MGRLMEAFPAIEELAPRLEDERGWVQVLHESERMVLKRSFSRAGVFRGMHLQLEPSPQVKLIRVVSGRIIDFVAAVHEETPAIRHCELGPDCGWIRIGADFAHGFYALEDTLFEYVCDGRYDEARERSFSIPEYLERQCGIVDPLLSRKDQAATPIG